MCTSRQLENIMKKMINCYNNYYGADIVDVFLYGSYARGDYDEESDINIVAIVKGKRRELQNKLKFIWDFSAEVGLEYDVVISPTVIPYDEYEKYKTILPYYINIENGGKHINV